MTVPLATATYTLRRATNISDDSGDPLTLEVVATGVRGVTMFFSGSASVAHGDRERVDARLAMDEDYGLKQYDQVYDEVTGDEWKVAWVRKRTGLGLEHLIIGVYEVKGTARGTRDL